MVEETFDPSLIYDAFDVLNLDKETADVYLFLIENGPTPIEDIKCISSLRKMRAIELLVSNELVNSGNGGIYTHRDAELPFNKKISALSQHRQILKKSLDELTLIGGGGNTKPLDTPDDFYEFEDQLFARAARSVAAATVRFKLAELRISTIEARRDSGVTFQVLGTVVDEETLDRAKAIQAAGAEVRHITGNIDDMLRFILFDSQSVLFAFRPKDDPKKHVGAWMRNKQFVQPLEEQFSKMWDKSLPAEEWSKFDFS